MSSIVRAERPPIARTRAAPLAVRAFEPKDAARWDDFVRAAPDGTFFHLSGWRRVIENAFRYPTYYLLAERDGEIVGVLPLTHLKSALAGNALISTAFCVYGGPLARDEAARGALEARAIELMDRLEVPVLEFRTKTRLHADWPTKDGLYVTFRQPMLADPAANLKAMPGKRRNMIKKAAQNGLRSEIDQDVDRHYAVYAESVRNLGTPVFAKSYFRLLKEEFGEACDIVTILKGDEALATMLNFYFRDEVLPYYGGGTTAARAVAGNDFLFWEVMRRACERGYRIYDFGRSKVGTGSYAFKKTWGFEPIPLHYQYRLAPRHEMPDVNPLSPKYRGLVAIWKRLPLPVSKLLGPPIARHFG